MLLQCTCFPQNPFGSSVSIRFWAAGMFAHLLSFLSFFNSHSFECVNYLRWVASSFTELYLGHKIFQSCNLGHLPVRLSRSNGLHCFPFAVCGDECTGLLLGDLARLEQMATSINLTGPLPAPYKMLYDLENRTQELKVGWTGNSRRQGKDDRSFDIIGKCSFHYLESRQAAVRDTQKLSSPMFFKPEN